MPKHILNPRPLRDWHLWAEVKRTITPLRPQPAETLPGQPLPLPQPLGPQPPVFHKGAPWTGPQLPPYRPPVNTPRRAPPGREIEPGVKKRVVRGSIDIDARIDLHGLTQDEARAALQRFVPARAARGDRTLLVITGKGLKTAPDLHQRERGVLRTMLPLWLAEAELTGFIAGWDVAAPGHGGEGAFYVRLRAAR